MLKYGHAYYAAFAVSAMAPQRRQLAITLMPPGAPLPLLAR